MNESSWNECLINNTSLKISQDMPLSRSLLQTARQRILFTEKKHASKEELKFVFEDYYSSLLEIMHAIMAIKGYKVLNHICLAFFMRDIMKMEPEYRLFDRLRIKRNHIIYYGRELEDEVLKEDLRDIKKLITTMEKTYEQMIKNKRD